MKLPAYHLRIISDTKATVFSVSLNDNRRIKWKYCASISMKTGDIIMLNNMPAPQDLRDFCDSWLSCIARENNGSGLAYEVLKAMGKLANMAGKLDAPIDKDLFEILIWSETSLKDALIANNGLAMLAEDNQEKYILQGQHYMNEGKYDLAEAEYLRALEYSSNRANLFNFLAVALAEQGKTSEAATAINQSIAVNPNKTGTTMRGVQYNLEAGNLDKARVYIDQMAEKKGFSSDQMLHLSRFAIRADMGTLGKKLAESIIQENRRNEPALEHLVNIVAKTEGEAAVFKVIRQHINALPNTPRLKEWYVRSLINSGKLELAQKAVDIWIASDGLNFQAQFQLGRVYLAKKKPNDALRELTKVEKAYPDNASTQKLIADAHIALGNLEAAMEASGKACKMGPENPNFIKQSKKITNLLLTRSSKGS